MTALAIVADEELTEQTHTSDTDFVDALTVPSASWVADQVYGLVVTAKLSGSDISTLFSVRVVHGAVPTVFNGSLMTLEPGGTDAYVNYTYIHKFTYAAGEDIKVQIQTSDAGETVELETIVLIAYPLDGDLVEGVDYLYGESTSSDPLTTVMADFASVTFEPENENDDWLVQACYGWDINVLNVNTEFQIDLDGVASNLMSEEGEDIDEIRVYGSSRGHTLSAASHTFKVQARDDGASAPQNDHNYSALLVLRLNKFEDHDCFWNEAEVVYAVDDTYEEVGNIEVTPGTTGDYISIGSISFDGAVGGKRGYLRIQEDGTTTPTGRDDHADVRSYDATDQNALFTMFKSNWVASVETDLDLDSKANTIASGPAAEDRSLVAFSVELAAAPAPAAPGLPEYGQVRSAIGDPSVYGATILRS